MRDDACYCLWCLQRNLLSGSRFWVRDRSNRICGSLPGKQHSARNQNHNVSFCASSPAFLWSVLRDHASVSMNFSKKQSVTTCGMHH